MGKFLILFGICLIGLGLLFEVTGKIPGFGRLPGDLFFRKGNMSFYIPITTSILASIGLSLLLSFFTKR